jgi:hypothetical protein
MTDAPGLVFPHKSLEAPFLKKLGLERGLYEVVIRVQVLRGNVHPRYFGPLVRLTDLHRHDPHEVGFLPAGPSKNLSRRASHIGGSPEVVRNVLP